MTQHSKSELEKVREALDQAAKFIIERMDEKRRILQGIKPELLGSRTALELQIDEAFRALDSLQAKAAQVSDEPVGEIRNNPDDIGNYADFTVSLPIGTKLYTRPQPKPADAVGPSAWMHYDADGSYAPSLYDWANPIMGKTVRPMYFRDDEPARTCTSYQQPQGVKS